MKRPDAFPLESIPPRLRGMALALSPRYAVAPSVVTMAMMSVLGAAAGCQIDFEPWPGHPVPACLNVLFSPACPVVEAVWAPLMSAQQAQVNGLVGLDAESLDREAARLRRERDQYVEHVSCRPADLLHFDEPLADIRLARHPAVLHDPLPGGIEPGVGHTAVLFGSPGRAGLAIDHWTSEAGAPERELLVAGWNQRADSRTCASGSVSVTVVASPDDAVRLLTAPLARSGLAGTFLVVGDDNPPASDESPGTGADQWADWVQRLFSWRHAGQRMTCGTLRLTFKLHLEDAREVLLDLDDSVDFRHGAYTRSVAIVGDQVRKVFEAIVAEPLLTTVNQYVQLKLDAGQASAGAVENPDAPSFPQFPSPNATEADGHRSSGPEDS